MIRLDLAKDGLEPFASALADMASHAKVDR